MFHFVQQDKVQASVVNEQRVIIAIYHLLSTQYPLLTHAVHIHLASDSYYQDVGAIDSHHSRSPHSFGYFY